MTEEEAIAIATSLVVDTLGEAYKVMGAKKLPRHPSEWRVLFETTREDGPLTNTPTIVIVEEGSRQARFFRTL